MIEGPIELSTDLDELRRVATRIGRRYMGVERADEFGARNAAGGELLVRDGGRTCWPRQTWLIEGRTNERDLHSRDCSRHSGTLGWGSASGVLRERPVGPPPAGVD